MVHLHGEHDCYCPLCGAVVTVEEGVMCAGVTCPDCGTPMRAVDIGEKRLSTEVMVPQEIYGYTQGELAEALIMMEDSMKMGQEARITLCTESLPSQEALDAAYTDMLAIGCHLKPPTARMVGGIPTTEFVLRKGSPQWTAILPLIVPILIIGLITFGIFRLESITKALMPILLVAIGGLVIIGMVYRKPATAYIERGGKIPGLPQANVPAASESKKVAAVR